MVGKLF